MIASTNLAANDDNLPEADQARIEALYEAAHDAAREHIFDIYDHEELLDKQDTIAAIENLPDNPAVAPWCGCEDCWIREVGHALEPYMEKVALIRWGLRQP